MKTSNRINIKRELIWTFGIIKNNLFSVIFFCSPSQSLMNTFSFFFLREKVKFLKGKKLKIFTWSPIKQISWYYVLGYRFSYKAFQGVLGWAKPLPDLHDVVRLSGFDIYKCKKAWTEMSFCYLLYSYRLKGHLAVGKAVTRYSQCHHVDINNVLLELFKTLWLMFIENKLHKTKMQFMYIFT